MGLFDWLFGKRPRPTEKKRHASPAERIVDAYSRVTYSAAQDDPKLLAILEMIKNASLSELESSGNPYGVITPLHVAVEHRHIQAVKLLLQKGVNPNIRDSRGGTPLHWVNGPSDEVDILIQAGADINATDNEGKPAWQRLGNIAVARGRPAGKKGPPLSDRVKEIARDRYRKIEAIKVYREETGAGLAEAKEAVEAYINSL
ncbi:MAG: ankyrin repeat domain-containing protein [Planctomycetes bacterium]|nr:ankyrin repeat domain-containing protein [Planctomycetota bacterium]